MTLVTSSLALLAAGLGAVVVVSGAPAAQTMQVAAANPAHGAQLFLQCRACHTIAPGAPNAVGPNLSGVVGSRAASRPGYAYSPALTKFGMVWTPANLDAFLKRPGTAVPGTKMGFAGVADAQARADLIAYLTTLKARK